MCVSSISALRSLSGACLLNMLMTHVLSASMWDVSAMHAHGYCILLVQPDK